MRILILACLCASPVYGDSLCGVRDMTRLLDILSGDWERRAHVSMENETVSMLRHTARDFYTIDDSGTLETRFIDDQVGKAINLTLAEDVPYDVDAVDDILETTETPQFADKLSDTPCGPEDLPQLQATLPRSDDAMAFGTITLIPYFTDRILEITELELRSEATIIFMTATALLVPGENRLLVPLSE